MTTISSAHSSDATQNSKRATVQSDSFINGVVSIKSCSHAETYRIVISDAAKIGNFLITSKFLRQKLSFVVLFLSEYNAPFSVCLHHLSHRHDIHLQSLSVERGLVAALLVDRLSAPRSWLTACEASLYDISHKHASTYRPASHPAHGAGNAQTILVEALGD